MANVSKPVEDAIEAMIIKKMDEIFLPQFCEMLHAASINSFDAAIRKEEPSAETVKVQQATLQFFLSLFDKKVVALVGTKNDTPATLEVKAKKMQENISKDASLVAGNYINLIKNAIVQSVALCAKKDYAWWMLLFKRI